MKIPSVLKNPYLLFSPFLIAFIIWVFISPTNGRSGDESRYLFYAQNMLQGYYSPPPPNIELTNGPGYPLLLIPFVALGLPLICITILNAFLYYFSIILLYKALRLIVTLRTTLIFSFLWAVYYIGYQGITFIHTETAACFLISALIYLIMRAFTSQEITKARKFIILSGLTMGYIVLTKIIFGNVLMLLLIGCFFLWILNRKSLNYRKGVIIVLVAFATTAPYLVYTLNLTGRLFYWGPGGDCLYWMSSSNPNEFGSWFPDKSQELEPIFYTYYIPGCQDSIAKYHDKELQKVYSCSGLERDDEYRKLAIANIKAHPLNYAKNVGYNIGRLLFQFPFSYGIHRPKILMVFPLNGIIFTLIIISLIPTLVNWKKLIFPLKFLLIFTLIYLGGSALVTAYLRMFTIIVPVLIFWMAYILQNTMKFNLTFNANPDLSN